MSGMNRQLIPYQYKANISQAKEVLTHQPIIFLLKLIIRIFCWTSKPYYYNKKEKPITVIRTQTMNSLITQKFLSLNKKLSLGKL
jgi:hypothetical protein